MNLTAQKPRTYLLTPDVEYDDVPCTSGVFKGAALSDVGSPGAGTDVAANLTAGENFLGFADETSPNPFASKPKIRVTVKGVVKLAVTGVVAGSLKADVYASDGDTFTLTIGSNSKIGKVVEFVSSGVAWVSFG